MSENKEEKKEVEVYTDLRNPDVVTKYRLAGDIASQALKVVTDLCKSGAKCIDLCEAGDKYILEAVSKIYKGKKVQKGISFPTCVTLNNFVGHVSSETTDDRVLSEGDLCKIDLGVHVDGYIAVVADTLCVGGPAKEKAGNLLAAIHYVSEAALRMIKIGKKNTEVTQMISKIAADFKCNAVQGVLSHQMEQFVIDGKKTIINKEAVDEKVEEAEFQANEVYAVDIVLSTGEGKPKESEILPTVFKRNADKKYQLKMKASKQVFSKLKELSPTFPFSMRSLDVKSARFGLKECSSHDLVSSYPVLYEKEGELVAHVKFTALLMPNGTIKVSGPMLNPSMFETDLKVTDEELLKLLATSANKKKKKKNNKKKKKKPTASE